MPSAWSRRVRASAPYAAMSRLRVALASRTFHGSREYWESRYAEHGTSGHGSYGELAHYKAGFLNSFVRDQHVGSVVEFGCGDGRQLALADYPSYVGFDVSPTAVDMCRHRFADDPTKQFLLYDPAVDPGVSAELALSLDVVYHLVEDEIYEQHLRHLFGAAQRFVILYTSDADDGHPRTAPHVRHRAVQRDIAARFPSWQFVERVANPSPFEGVEDDERSWSDFFLYAQ